MGMVVEVGPTYAKVATILDVMLEISSYDSRTKDIGITTGRIDLAEEGLCQLTLLQRERAGPRRGHCDHLQRGRPLPQGFGDRHHPGGCGPRATAFPLYAVIEPAVDVRTVKDVLVITSFEGQASAAE